MTIQNIIVLSVEVSNIHGRKMVVGDPWLSARKRKEKERKYVTLKSGDRNKI